MSTTEKLKDESIMPFGAHKGNEMANIPDNYLYWYWGENKEDYQKGKLNGYGRRVMDYIRDSFNAKDLR